MIFFPIWLVLALVGSAFNFLVLMLMLMDWSDRPKWNRQKEARAVLKCMKVFPIIWVWPIAGPIALARLALHVIADARDED